MVLASDVSSGIPVMAAPQPTGEAFDFVADLADALVNAINGVSVLNYDATADGVADDEPEISNALTAAVSASRWLVFPPGTYLVESDITFTVPVLFMGGVLKLAAGVTATFNQPYMNPSKQQCFDEQGRLAGTAGGVRVAETSPQDTVRPEDWGAVPDNSTANAHIPIQQAIDAFDYSTSSFAKVGRVLFSSGTYLLGAPIFVGYDWINYSTDWADIDAVGATTCWRGHANSAQSRKQHVILEGIGYACLKRTGSVVNRQYLLYYSGEGNGKAFEVIKNLALDCQYLSRGAYLSHQTFGKTFNGLEIYKSLHIGVEFSECWGSQLLNCFFWYCKGQLFRGRNMGGCYLQSLIGNSARSHLDASWPAIDEDVVSDDQGSSYTQTRAWERGLFSLDCNGTQLDTLLIESCQTGSALNVAVAADKKTCTLTDHGLQAGDPIRLDVDGIETTVASVTNSSVFVTTDAWTSAGSTSRLIYRRCSGITKANPGVITCQNHNLVEGQHVKIMAATGMTELNDIWYRVKYIDADSFSLWSVWDGTIDSEVGVTALDTSGYGSVGDGTEYIIAGGPGLVVDPSVMASLKNLRFEANSILRSKIMLLHGCENVTVEDIICDDAAEGLCDYVVEWQSKARRCTVNNVRAQGIRKAAVEHDTYVSGYYAFGCEVKQTRCYSAADESVETEAIAEWNGSEENNIVEGATTPASVSDQSGTGTGTVSVYSSLPTAEIWVPNPVLEIAADFNNTITDFDKGYDGLILRVFFLGGNAVVEHGSDIVTLSGSNLTPSANTMVTFLNRGGTWYEV